MFWAFLVGAATAPWFPTPAATYAPAVKATPPPFVVSGYARAYQFDRQNASNDPSGRGQLNQQSINFAVAVRIEHSFRRSPWTIGATYIGADPFNANGPCSHATNYVAGGSCQQYPSSANAYKESDTALPGFGLSTLSELYIQYASRGFAAKIGDQFLNLPWAGPSDTRVKAAYYEGADLHYAFAPGWTAEVARIVRWEGRPSSSFNRSTQLTMNPDGGFTPTPGFLFLGVSFSPGPSFGASAGLYQFYDIANFAWFEGKMVSA